MRALELPQTYPEFWKPKPRQKLLVDTYSRTDTSCIIIIVSGRTGQTSELFSNRARATLEPKFQPRCAALWHVVPTVIGFYVPSGYGIEAVTWFEYTLSTLLESTAVVT